MTESGTGLYLLVAAKNLPIVVSQVKRLYDDFNNRLKLGYIWLKKEGFKV